MLWKIGIMFKKTKIAILYKLCLVLRIWVNIWESFDVEDRPATKKPNAFLSPVFIPFNTLLNLYGD
jgi:hypothetical protein